MTPCIIRPHPGPGKPCPAGDAAKERRTQIVHCDRERLESAWREFVRNADPRLSLCDALSFVVMRERGVTRALSLDRHFSRAGFELLP
jgi:predicted nucleic acid-binding protein